MDINNLEPHKIVDRVLQEAVALHASDIYWLPEDDSYSVRCKVNGEQQILYRIGAEAGQQCTSRLKVMAQLLTYRNQISQDGVIKDEAMFANAEFRVAVMPTVNGERITVRILDKRMTPQHLDELNFAPEVISQLQTLLSKNSGMIVLTGPTGCARPPPFTRWSGNC